MNTLSSIRLPLPAVTRAALLAGAVLLGGATLLGNPASANELGVGQATVTPLSETTSATTYVVDRPDGYHIIVTVTTGRVAGADALHQPPVIRFASRILPGQTINLSMPEAAGSSYPVIQITRRAERVAVETKPRGVLTD